MTWAELKEEVEGRAKAAGIDPETLLVRAAISTRRNGLATADCQDIGLDPHRRLTLYGDE